MISCTIVTSAAGSAASAVSSGGSVCTVQAALNVLSGVAAWGGWDG